jgi:hypothetical protein
MLPDLNRVIEQVSKEKGIDRQIIVEALEQAMLSAAKRTFGPDKAIEAKFNPEVGEVELFEIKRVVTEIEDRENEVLLADARKNLDPDAEVGDVLLATYGWITSSCSPSYGWVGPPITAAASFASGTPVVFETNGTVREPRGFTSSTYTAPPLMAYCTFNRPTTPRRWAKARVYPRISSTCASVMR